MIWGKAFFSMTRKWGGWDVYAGVAMSPTTALSSTQVELAPALDQAATALQRTWNVLTADTLSFHRRRETVLPKVALGAGCTSGGDRRGPPAASGNAGITARR